MTWTTLIFLTIVCLALEAFFSGSELALVSADKLKLTHRAARGHRGARMALTLARKPEWFFSATLLGQTLFVVGNSILVTFFIFDHFGPNYELFGLVLSPLILIFGEAIPKTLFQQWSDRLTPLVAPVILFFSYLFSPIVWPLSKLTLLLLGGVRGSLLSGHEVTRESLEVLLRESEVSREISQVFKKSLLKILRFTRKKTSEIMTPLVEVFSLRDGTSVEEAALMCGEEAFSVVPIFQRRAYNIVGIVNFVDLLLAKNPKAPLSSLMQAPLYVTERMRVRTLFLLFRDQKKKFAVVVDEYGAAVGIVTLEDILEEVVGEIEDEFDEEQKNLVRISASQYQFQGRVSIDEMNEKFHWQLPKENYSTLAGFLLDKFGCVPKTGDVLHYGDLTFLIKTATPRSIEEVLIEIG